jgi:chemotaxis protein histidine kinase CheA
MLEQGGVSQEEVSNFTGCLKFCFNRGMLPEDLAKYKPLFLQTAWDYLRTLENNVRILSDDSDHTAAIEALHISAHSLKSQSLVMQYEQLGMVCHDLEFLFKDMKDGKKVLTNEQIDIVINVIDGMKDSLSTISTEGTDTDMSEERNKLRELTGVPGG